MNNLINILYIILFVLVIAVIGLFVVFIKIKGKENSTNESKSEKEENVKANEKKDGKGNKIAKEYDAKSVFDFMEFEKVEDNMIIQNKGRRFLMAIECQGVNYDLMSDVEKASTEQGFAILLNTLREPIQIYIQARTVNLEKNIQTYKQRLNKIKDNLNLKEYKLKQFQERLNSSNNTNNANMILRDRKLDVIREQNLYNYGRDIIADTEKMSLNKNVLRKKYYIIIKYFYESTGEELRTEDEIKDIAFSTLYTKATAMIRTLAGIGIVGKALDSYELVDLLYNAYNRDESEVFGIDKAVNSGFNEIYIDAQNVLDTKIEALNKEIEQKAQERAQEVVEEVKDERKKELQELEDNIDDIITQLAKKVVEENERTLGEETAQKAIKKLNNRKKGEKKEDVKEKTKETSRKRRAG